MTTTDDVEYYVKVPVSQVETWVDSLEQISDPQVSFRENHLDEAKDALRWCKDLAEGMISEMQGLIEP